MRWILLSIVFGCAALCAAEEKTDAQARADALCCGCILWEDDTYMQGYLQALIDLHFLEHRAIVCVEGCTIYVSNLPNNCLVARSIVRFLADFPGVDRVIVDQNCKKCKPVKHPTPDLDCCNIQGIWFPQGNELYPPMIADPRQVLSGAAWRFHDDIIGSRVGAVKFGDPFPIFRWLNVGPCCGDLQLGFEGGAWAIFKFGDPSLSQGACDGVALINTDFLAGIPLTYACGCWAFRLRFYHISSHLGDEFLVSMPVMARVNPSREALDFFASYQMTDAIRVYGGIGVNTRSDCTFTVKPLYFEYGAELRLLGRRNLYQCLYIQPYLAMHIRNWQDLRWRFDGTYQMGIEVSKLQGLGRKARFFVEYHDGFSFEGQFSKMRTEYVSIGLTYGY